MNATEHSMWTWAGFGVFILFMLSIDLGLLNRKARTFTYQKALTWSAVWIGLAMVFAGIVFRQFGNQRGLEFLTGYLIELSLSVDNLFIFVLIFSFFRVPAEFQHRVLFWGVLGALVMRVTMILFGAVLIARLGQWILYLFGAFLVYTGIRMFSQEETEIEPEKSAILRLVTRYIPIAARFEEKHFFTRIDGRRHGTLLLLVLIFVEVTDLVFAVDSIPAIFAVTRDTFIIYTSNVFAILGLRTLYFLLAAVVEKFHYLKLGLAIVLTFIGAKMILPIAHLEIPISISLGVVAMVLLSSVAASFIWPKEAKGRIKVELPAGFGPPPGDK